MESSFKCCFLCMDIIIYDKSDKNGDHFPLVFETCKKYIKNEMQDTQNPLNNETNSNAQNGESPVESSSLCENCFKSAERLWGMDLELEFVRKRMEDFINEFKSDIAKRAYSAIKIEKLSEENLTWEHDDLNADNNGMYIHIDEKRDPLEMDQGFEDTTPYCPNQNTKEIVPKKSKKMCVQDSKKPKLPKQPRSRNVKGSVTLDDVVKNDTVIDNVVQELSYSSDDIKKLVKGYQCSQCTTLYETADQLICTVCQTKKDESNKGYRKNFKKFNLKSTRANRHSRNDDSCEIKKHFPCNFCDMTFPQKSRLQAHLVNVHISSVVDGSETNTCTLCDIVYDDAELYKYHMQVKHKCT